MAGCSGLYGHRYPGPEEDALPATNILWQFMRNFTADLHEKK